MILKTMHNQSALATLQYVVRDGCRHLGGNMLGMSPRVLAREFGLLHALKPNLTKPVVHIVGAFAPEDHLSDDEMREIACRALGAQGYESSLYTIWRHTDGTTEHFHAITSQVDIAGRTISQSFERYRAKRTCRQLEKDFDLFRVGNLCQRNREEVPVPTPKPEPDGLDVEIPGVSTVVKDALGNEIRDALTGCKTFGELALALRQRGVAMVPQIHSETGQLYGMGYRIERGPLEGSFLAGSKVAGNFSASKLVGKHGLSFDTERDLPLLRNPPPQPSALSTPTVQEPQKPRRPKKGDRQNARKQRKRPPRVQPQESAVWGCAPTSLQAILNTGGAPQDTRLVRSLLGHSGGWAAPGSLAGESLFPGQRAGQGWLARPH